MADDVGAGGLAAVADPVVVRREKKGLRADAVVDEGDVSEDPAQLVVDEFAGNEDVLVVFPHKRLVLPTHRIVDAVNIRRTGVAYFHCGVSLH